LPYGVTLPCRECLAAVRGSSPSGGSRFERWRPVGSSRHLKCLLLLSGLEARLLSPLLRVGELLCQDGGEFFLRHAGPGKDARVLDLGRGGDDEDRVAAPLRTGFEQKRNVEHHERSPGGGRLPEEGFLFFPHERARPSISATIVSRRAGVTRGVTPNQRANPGTA
jgi:hypothetical protein